MIHIVHRDDIAGIDPLGAQLVSWEPAGIPLIWTPVPAIWDSSAPLLFPVVGWTRGGGVTIEGQRFPLGLHGFIRHLRFAVAERSVHHVRLVATATEETWRLYPYDFEFAVVYRLGADGLRTEIAVTNPGSRMMPYACGLHPGFRWPFAFGSQDGYSVVFAKPERPNVPVISADGLFTRDTRIVPFDGTVLPLSPALFAREALCFLNARSRTLRFAKRDGPAITITADGFSHIALWSKPEGGFVCLEFWTGRGDDADSDGDFLKKPSMIHLPPGACERHSALYTFERGPGRAGTAPDSP